jgi:hypothetical protein
LLSFRGISTPSLTAQGEQRRSSYFNIRRGNPGSPECNGAHEVSDLTNKKLLLEMAQTWVKLAELERAKKSNDNN